ncbi:hypothetical protein CC86DRAFT_404166 [Ophiobolus disseminans]|uniref:Uncharacterized protein n=1 Tax=Ophiobolus disseminans TaxID=1469910 RepID=A0A6A7A9Z3_9PLEO|nr:hypothetical protein CC86DRAFT_404166 [Ophiobolus disseminans]
MAPSVGPNLVASLLMLEKICWDLEHGPQRMVINRVYLRSVFTEALKLVKLKPGSKVQIVDDEDKPFNQAEDHWSIAPYGYSYDPFSASIRTFSYNLTTLILTAHVEATLFWPMLAPSGRWYFKPPIPDPKDYSGREYQSMDHDPLYYFRTETDPSMMVPFLKAFAKAVRHMPVIKHFELACPLMQTMFQITYFAPGLTTDMVVENKDDTKGRRMYYDVGDDWEPESDLMAGLRWAGKERFGGDVIERFLDRAWY